MGRSLRKFVPGASLPDKSEFVPPSNDYLHSNRLPNPPLDGEEPFIADLSTADA